ncbi:transcriptional regulator with XRE-family HTH domain [Chryseobacterium vietnamense]|uniref:Transcriptional regulator with XRE-family HTH domain n=1 Tax=Chryseobacterium vietnamense TaxID=866785 RepID=A0ACC6JDH5_9FLAO|nr:helix-turn-helix domain-containing protein [Chryseobacterium vietnamense]MDR6460905.1 transcriptional regulator with XRE-family HTH domain [Chryseobacterium vietnamense]
MSLGTKLKQLRQDKNWSQADAAYRLDISQPAYNKWETDQTKPNIDKLGKIAEVFETDIYELLENISTINFPNANFEGTSYVVSAESTINMQSPELIESILKNQEQISKLIESQNKLIESLLKK